MKKDESRKWIRRASTAAGLAYTAIAEYELARRLGAEPYIAVMLPMSIDCYVIAALKWFKALDVALSLILMGAAQVAAHALEAGVVDVDLNLVAVVSLLVPIALWRTHALSRDEGEGQTPTVPPGAGGPAGYTAPPFVERVPEAYPELPEGVPAVPEPVPEDVHHRPVEAAPVDAAEQPRTRPEAHAEYVPEPPAVGVPEPDDDRLTTAGLAWAVEQFKDELAAGTVPGIARIKAECKVGQSRAKEIQDAFREALPRLASTGAAS